ncbi:hypothetical protein [Pseudanabaena sp. PCC 6802]|uniref:hypothetical protein n=1 Tax=Pseudanabaena sp. PCC 6802 TaxID=118173 RepID=UPI00034A3B34|nr:hypothetical protein [Pseudanabaena sp. PCC 6802]
MATIQINELNPAGSDLFNDLESFMSDLTDEQINSKRGGCVVSVASIPYRLNPYITALAICPASSTPVCALV